MDVEIEAENKEMYNAHKAIWSIREVWGLKSNSKQSINTEKQNKYKVSMILIFRNSTYKG